MNINGQMDKAELKIQSAIGAYLQSRRSLTNNNSESGHLDNDVMSAFVEGNLTEIEAGPVTSHLTNCSFCRHVSAELIRLDSAFAEDSPILEMPASEPKRIGEVLNGILSRIFGGGDAAVFAHEEKDKDDDEKGEDS